MQIVIDIPEEWIDLANKGCFANEMKGSLYKLAKAIKHGITFPKYHGRLIDADKFAEDNKEFLYHDLFDTNYENTLRDLINEAPTILFAETTPMEEGHEYAALMAGRLLLRDILKYKRKLSLEGFNDFLESFKLDDDKGLFYEDMLRAGIDVIHLTDGDISVADELKKLEG